MKELNFKNLQKTELPPRRMIQAKLAHLLCRLALKL